MREHVSLSKKSDYAILNGYHSNISLFRRKKLAPVWNIDVLGR